MGKNPSHHRRKWRRRKEPYHRPQYHIPHHYILTLPVFEQALKRMKDLKMKLIPRAFMLDKVLVNHFWIIKLTYTRRIRTSRSRSLRLKASTRSNGGRKMPKMNGSIGNWTRKIEGSSLEGFRMRRGVGMILCCFSSSCIRCFGKKEKTTKMKSMKKPKNQKRNRKKVPLATYSTTQLKRSSNRS